MRRLAARAVRGYTLVAMMVGITIMMVMIAAVLPAASTQARREKEEELIFRGRQYAEGLRCFRRRYGRYPTSLREMLDARPRTLRKLWKDPITNSERWGTVSALVGAPAPGTQPPPIPGGPGGPRERGFGSSGSGGFGSTGSFGSTFGSGGRTPATPTPVPSEEGGGTFGGGSGDGDGDARSGSPDNPLDTGMPGPISGVYSTSSKKAMRMYQGRDVYRDWRFTEQIFTQSMAPDLGGPGGPRGGPGGPRGGPGTSGTTGVVPPPKP